MQKQRILKALPLLLGLAFLLGPFLFGTKVAEAANPTTINFQGKVVNSDGTNVSNGTYSFVFRIYNTSSPTMTTSCTSTATCLWQETQGSVTVTNGVFQVELGSACALTSGSCNNTAGGPINFANNNSLYLTMQFNGDTSGSNGGFMSPLIHLTSVPFALQSDNSANLGGIAAANYVQLATGNIQSDGTTNNSVAVNKTGASGNILLLEANGKAAVTVNNSGNLILGQAGASGLAGTLTFQNATDSSTASISFTGNSTASYTYLLPSTIVGSGQCLQSGTVSGGNVPLTFGSCATGGGYATIQDEGSALTQRSTVNFIGNSVNCVDNAGNSRTDCTVAPTLQNAYDNSGTPATILTSSSTKNIVFQSGSGFNSTGAFQIQNAAGDTALSVDTTSLNNLIANPSFENASTTGWTANGTGASRTTTSAQQYIGSYALDFTTGTAIGNEVRYNIGTAMSTSTTYTLSFYAKAGTAMSTLSASYSPDGTAGNETDCAVFNPSRSVVTTGWTRYYCTIDTSATAATSSGYIAIKQSDSTSRHLYIDAVQLEAGSSITQGLVGETGFESALTNWAAITGSGGSGNTAVQSSADHYNGANDLLITDATTPAAGTGAKYTTANTNPRQLATSTGYTLSFWAKASGSNFSTLISGYARDGSTQKDCSLNSNSVVTTGWTYYSCIISTDGVSPAASAYLYIEHSGTASTTWVVDDVQLTKTSTVVTGSAFKETGIALNGVINSPTVFKNQSDSVSGFQIQSSTGTALLLADTLNSRIQFGTNGTATGQVYVSGIAPTLVGQNSDTNIGGGFIDAVQGHYVYVCDSTNHKLEVYDVSSPANPLFIAQNSDTNISGNCYLSVQGHYAYIASGTSHKLLVYDISNPQTPTFVAQNSDSQIAADVYIYVQGRYAYIVGGTKLYIYDISNPSSPTFVAKNSDSNLTNANSVFVQGRYAYIDDNTNAKLDIYDVSNPSSPTFVAKNSDTNMSNPVDIVVQGRYAYLIDNSTKKLYIYDVSNPSSPSYVSQLVDSNMTSALVLKVQGRYAYVSSSTKMEVYDISNPTAPSFVTVATANCWALALQGRYAYCANSKINVMDLGGLYTSAFEAGSAEVNLLNVDSNASFAADASISGGLTVGQSLQVNGNIGSSGQVLFQNSSNSTTSFQVQNAIGDTALSVDTTSINALISNPSFENASTTGWTASGTGASITTTNSQHYIGSYALDFTTGTAIGNEARYNIGTGLSTSTTYTLSFYAETNSAFSTLSASYSPDGTAGNETDCAVFNPSRSVVTTGWTRYYCTINTSSTAATSSGFIAIKQSDATSRHLYIDAVQIEAGSSITQGLVGETGFESALVNWAAITGSGGSGNTAVQSSADHYNGSNDLLITDATTPAAGTGAKYTTGNTNPRQLATLSTYTLSFWAKASGSNFSTLIAGYARDGSTQTNCTLSSTSVVTTGWSYYSCVFASDNTAPSASAYLYIEHSGTVSTTWMVDDVQLTKTSTIVTGSSFKETGIALNGVINSPIVIQNQADSTTALQVQNASGTNILSVDSLNQRLSIGSSGTPAGQLYIAGLVPSSSVSSLNTDPLEDGYVYVQGRYAYICRAGASGGLYIYNIANPSSPYSVGNVSISQCWMTSVQGRYAYISTTSGLLQIVDVSNPSSPTLLGSVSVGSSTTWITVQGRYAYIVNSGTGKLYSVDVSNPSQPAILNSISTGINPGVPAAQGRYVYIPTFNTTGRLEIYDVSNPSNISSAGSVNSNNTHSGILSIQGGYAYMTQGTQLSVFDVSIPGTPQLVGSSQSIDQANLYNSIFVQGRYAYIGGNRGTVIYDISTPTSPNYVGQIDQNTPLNRIYVQGRYLYAIEDHLNSSNNNIRIYDLGGTYSQQLEAGGTETGTLQVDSNAQVVGDFNLQGGLSVGQSIQAAGPISTSTGLQIASTGNTGGVAISLASTTSSYSLILPASAGATNQCLVNTSTPGTLQWLPCGAGSTAKIVLTPEFVGAVMTPVSLTGWTNSGTMTSDFCSGSSRQNINTSICTSATESHNYYAWTASANCVNYDIWVRWSVPNDFASFASSNNNFNAWKTGTSTTCNSVSGNDDVKVNAYTDSSASSCASQSMTNTGGSWQNTAITMTGCTPNPGDVLTFDIQLKVNTSGDFARIGEITLNYNRN